ncbi:hypothetical protein HAX54_034132 [Datura stramonium]|uniref:Uncharacterized protein n=1 Tax=Datura stramonium TaxID=4076 RepID=A0ABS8VH75_DATST|nr:hypothetical protein [Datura stramonium]
MVMGPRSKLWIESTFAKDNAQGNLLRDQDPYLRLDDLILDTPISYNPPPSHTPARTRKILNPKRLVLANEASSSQNPSPKGDGLVQTINLNETPAPTDAHGSVEKPNIGGASEIGEVDIVPCLEPVVMYEETENEEEIIEGFIISLVARVGGSGEKNPLGGGMKKARTSSRSSFNMKKRTKRGPVTRGIEKRSMDDILQESHHKTMKRRRMLRVVEETPEVRRESHRSSKVKAKEKKVVVPEEPGATTKNLKGSLFLRIPRREAYLALLKAEHTISGTCGEPGAVLALQNENALLKDEDSSLKKQLEDMTQQMLYNQRAANERIEKLLSKI